MKSCDHGSRELSCAVQVRKLKQGYVMLVDYKWVLKKNLKDFDKMLSNGEIWLSDEPDWIHVHCTGNCIENYKEADPKGYKKTCKYFGVDQ